MFIRIGNVTIWLLFGNEASPYLIDFGITFWKRGTH